MVNTDNILKQKASKSNPFTVPEGYFSQLQKDIMESLPEGQTKVVKMTPRHRFLRPAIIGAAASVLIAVGGLSIYFHNLNTAEESAVEASVEASAPSEADNYIMMDNEAMYAYMYSQSEEAACVE